MNQYALTFAYEDRRHMASRLFNSVLPRDVHHKLEQVGLWAAIFEAEEKSESEPSSTSPDSYSDYVELKRSAPYEVLQGAKKYALALRQEIDRYLAWLARDIDDEPVPMDRLYDEEDLDKIEKQESAENEKRLQRVMERFELLRETLESYRIAKYEVLERDNVQAALIKNSEMASLCLKIALSALAIAGYLLYRHLTE